jgi:hypothetical protein
MQRLVKIRQTETDLHYTLDYIQIFQWCNVTSPFKICLDEEFCNVILASFWRRLRLAGT